MVVELKWGDNNLKAKREKLILKIQIKKRIELYAQSVFKESLEIIQICKLHPR